MTFDDVLAQVQALLQREYRVSYRGLKRRFGVDDEYIEDLKEELIGAKRCAVEEDGRFLVWVGEQRVISSQSSVLSPQSLAPNPQSPISYTPSHLAERIRSTSVTDGERKTITAVFADLKGSTALIEGLDPEEARAIIDPALQLMMDAVHRYEGYVAQALGDGIFALFGAPIAHEDHPQRALYAALRMQEEMQRYSDQVRLTHGVPLAMRVGINTGEVVVRSIRKDDLHADYVPVGHSTNLAARMEQMATPGSILVTAYTQRLTEGYFEFKNLGQTQIKGVEEPLQVYEVLGAGPLRTRLQVAAQRGLTRFVGRQTELEQMRRALERAKAGHGQIVGVMGEPGLGKSRLVYEFKLLSQSGCLLLEAYSVSHGKASPYLPVIELLKSYFDIHASDDERKRREKVNGKVLTLDHSLEDTLPYLFALLGIEEQPSALQQMDSQIRRRRTFDALKKLSLRESLNQPLILVFEDLHWIDSETQGVLDILSEGIASAKILLLVNYRPEYRHEWGSKTYYTQLRLEPFGRAEAEEFLDMLLGTDTTLMTLKHQILTKTEGTPFFIEEVVQALVEDGTVTGERGHHTLTQPVTNLQLPTTVHGVLAARIDRLAPEEKAVLQQLAVIGREFPLRLIRQVITQPAEELYRLLTSLLHKEFLYEQPAFPEVEYLFKHALTQEVAYNSVLIEQRKALHERTAQAMELLYHDRLEEHSSELAHQYSRSRNSEKAIEYLQKAGQQAVQQSAHREAITHFTAALELLKTLPDTPERVRQELDLHVALAVPWAAIKGLAAQEVGNAYARALELCSHLEESTQLFLTLWGARRFYLFRAELQTARELAEQVIPLAQHLGDPARLSAAHYGLGSVLHVLGELVAARTHLERAIALYDPRQRFSAIAHHGADLGGASLCMLAIVLWLLGYPDQARKWNLEALTLLQTIDHPFTRITVWVVSSLCHQLLRDAQTVGQQAEAIISLAQEQGASSVATGEVRRGWALVEQGQVEEGIQQLQQGMAALQAIGMNLYRSYYLALLADASRKRGLTKEGLIALTEAQELAASAGEHWYEAELYRLKGELTRQQASKEQRVESGEHEAEGHFLKAIDIAQKQHAKSLELRATMSLARLWLQQGKRAEAYQMLSTIYTWFTEGFDTKDLQEAKALLLALQ